MPPPTDILLAQRFLPEMGGSIAWMHDVYRRWPQPVQVITHDYYSVALGTASYPQPAARPAGGGDHVTSENLLMDRRDIFLRDWGMDRWGKARKYWRMMAAVRERFKAKPPAAGGAGKAVVRVHCIHAVPEAVSLIPLKWRYGRRLKVICYAHGEEITACLTSRQLTFLMHRAHGLVDLMIANSRNTQRLLSNHIDPAKVVVVHPGVDLPAFDGAAEAGQAWRQAQGLQDRLIVLTLARLDVRKNQAMVMRAVAELARRHPNLLYVMAGGGGQMEALKQLASELNLSGRVRFTGEVDGATKLALYGACDVFAMPAIQHGTDLEGFGMVFLEAGACGKPSIAGHSGGQAEAVNDGETGLVVDGHDLSAVTAALDRLLSDPALRQSMGNAGRRKAEAHDWPRVVQRTVELVENVTMRNVSSS
jgi:phosphatidylinositol alpha-1,6-mannosyltransferase